MDASTQAPAHLAGDAQEFYQKNFPLLWELGTITETDYELFLMTCEAWGDFLSWKKQESLAVEEGDRDALFQIFELKQRSMRQYLALSSKVGMSALDRGKVKREKKKGDALGRFRI